MTLWKILLGEYLTFARDKRARSNANYVEVGDITARYFFTGNTTFDYPVKDFMPEPSLDRRQVLARANHNWALRA